MSEIEAPIRGLIGVIRRLDSLERLERDPDAFLAELGVEAADRAALLELGVDRLRAYRSLVHNGTRNVISRFLPRTKHFLGSSRLRSDVEAFIAEVAAQSPYLRTVPGEFVRWVEARWKSDETIAPFIPELAHYELLAEEVPNRPAPTPAATGLDLALEQPVLTNPTASLLSFAWRVDRVDPDQPVPPTREALELLVCRDGSHAYRERALSPLGAALFEGLCSGATLRDAIFAAAARLGEEVGDPLLERATYALGEMVEIEALLGARSTASAAN
jgi:hypothetical protein